MSQEILLNEKQQIIVNDLSGQILVVACPGSGKTTVMVARTKALIDSGVNENEILVITFTNTAASSMKSRYTNAYGPTNIIFCTIHSACYNILVQSRVIDRNSLINGNDQMAFIGDFIKNHKIPVEGNRKDFIRQVLTDISYIKNAETNPHVFKSSLFEEEDQHWFTEIYQAYEQYKRKSGLIDFDDMLILARDTLKNDPQVLEYYQKQWKHIMIDEFQDTNRVQAEIFYMLAGDNGNLCVVGDDDQSIYGFRSADSSIMLGFPEKFPNSKTYYLDTNYRSMPDIIKKADAVIRHNTVRFEKDFKAGRTGDAEIDVKKFASEVDEAKKIKEEIVESVKGNKDDFKKYAVLYRNNKQNQMLVNELAQADIPFYTTEPIKDIHSEFIFMDIMTYYRLSNNTPEKYDIPRILNRPNRYLKRSLFEGCRLNESDMLSRCKGTAAPKAAEGKVRQMFFDLSRLSQKKPLDFVNYMYFNMAYYESALDYASVMGITEKSVKYMLDFIKKEAEKFDTMEDWKQYAIDFAKKLEKARKEKKGICLSTFHSSKGLEWENVYMIGCNDGVVPSDRAEDKAAMEEERRLFYVAMTRAKKKLQFSYYADPTNKKLVKSPFIDEALSPVEQQSKTQEKEYFLVIAENSCGIYSSAEEFKSVLALHKKGKHKKVTCSNMAQALEMLARLQIEYFSE